MARGLPALPPLWPGFSTIVVPLAAGTGARVGVGPGGVPTGVAFAGAEVEGTVGGDAARGDDVLADTEPVALDTEVRRAGAVRLGAGGAEQPTIPRTPITATVARIPIQARVPHGHWCEDAPFAR